MVSKNEIKEGINETLEILRENLSIWFDLKGITHELSEEALQYVDIDFPSLSQEMTFLISSIKDQLANTVEDFKIQLTKEMVEDVFKKYEEGDWHYWTIDEFEKDVQTLMESFKYKRQKRV